MDIKLKVDWTREAEAVRRGKTGLKVKREKAMIYLLLMSPPITSLGLVSKPQQPSTGGTPIP